MFESLASRPIPTSKKTAVTSKEGHDETSSTTPKIIPEERDWLTRYQASDRLSCSLQTLANYERKGVLHPKRSYRLDGRGIDRLVIVYDPQEVNKLAVRLNRGTILPRDAGEVTGRAFDLFDEGKSEREIIRELRLTVEAVQELHEKWRDTGGTEIIISPNAKVALEKVVGPFKTVTDLVERLENESFVIMPDGKRALEQIVGPFKTVVELIDRLMSLRAEPK